MIGLFIVSGTFFVLAVALDVYFGRHPLKKVDRRVEKYRWKGW